MFGTITANVAAYFVEERTDDDTRSLEAKLDRVLAELEVLRRQQDDALATARRR